LPSEAPLSARCLCGAASLQINSLPLRVSACHCNDCRRRTGSLFSAQARFHRSDVELSGSFVSYIHPTDSGGTVSFYRCDKCLTTLYYEIEQLAGFVAIPLGVMSDLSEIAPTVEVFYERCPKWLQLTSIEERF